ncbi:hypothetical protein HMPREF1548_00035 [Clostridium sp. KLE 1755]|nr:hypothetical protein HMPREF1548_00035 [Clostridium sp. KLE 1755]
MGNLTLLQYSYDNACFTFFQMQNNAKKDITPQSGLCLLYF